MGSKQTTKTTVDLARGTQFQDYLSGTQDRTESYFQDANTGEEISAEEFRRRSQAGSLGTGQWSQRTRSIKGAQGAIQRQYGDIEKLFGMGPGEQDVQAGLQSQRDFASMLEEYQRTGGLPSAADQASARDFARTQFDVERTRLGFAMEDERQQAARLAARLNRAPTDPIIQAKLAAQRMRGEQDIGAREAAFGSEFGLNLAQQRLGYAQSAAQMRSGLASQAMQNRLALLGLGQQLQGAERQYQLSRSGSTSTTSSPVSLADVVGAVGAGASLVAGIPMAAGAIGTLFGSKKANPTDTGVQHGPAYNGK